MRPTEWTKWSFYVTITDVSKETFYLHKYKRYIWGILPTIQYRTNQTTHYSVKISYE